MIPNCPDCGHLLGLDYAECATCAHHSNDYTVEEYNDRVLADWVAAKERGKT
jgi:arginine decarboxylase-like protein